MIPILLAGECWLFAFALGQLNIQTAVFVAVFGLGFCLFILRKLEKLVKFTFAFTTVIFLVVFAAVSQNMTANLNPKSLESKSFELARVRLTLESQVKFGFWKADLHEVDGLQYSTPVLVSDASKSALHAGCILNGLARLVPSEHSDRFWLLKMQNDSFKQVCSSMSLVGQIKANFLSQLRGLNKDARGLVAGLSIGDTSLLSEQLGAQMKLLSLTHLTAVSGANCAIVLGLVLVLLRKVRLPRLIRTLSAVAFLGLYLLLVGPQSSVLRAAFMSVVIMALVTAGRAIGAIGALSWATIGLLLINPGYASDYGFALSVAATAGILLLTPWLFRIFQRRLPSWLAGLLAVSAAAQMLCAPILLQLQPGLPTYSLIANSLVEPLVVPITVLGLVACLMSAAGLFFLVGPISWLASVPAEVIIAIVQKLCSMPWVTLWWPNGLLGTALMTLFAAAAVIRVTTARRHLATAIALICSLVLVFLAIAGELKSSQWPILNWRIINCNVGQGDSLLLRSGHHLALIDVGRDAKPIKDCLDRLGVKRLDLLVLTHFDADHVGGLSGALKGRQVELGMTTDFQDERPQALAIESELRAGSRRVVRAFAGMEGQLGDIRWLVMQPEIHGEGSEDPNDGSITMRWDAPTYTLFTMADLGEKGQMRLVQLHPGWIGVDHSRPVILKVSHHGSADQYPELIEALHPDLAIISVGAGNPYGHPTARTLAILQRIGARVSRTDKDGAISVGDESGVGLFVRSGG